ncbi:MAG: arylsulfatase [Pirellulaceae bacterium]
MFAARRFVGSGMVALVMCLGGMSSGWSQEAPATVASPALQRPNIVFVLADDLGYNDCSFGGESRYRTENLEQLAKQATILRSLYVQPVCTPTRAALMSGRYPMRYGLQVGVIRPDFTFSLDLAERTLAEELHDLGYHTSIVGKWHLGWSRPEMLPLARGFDNQYGMLTTGAIDYYTHRRAEVGIDWYREQEVLDEPGYSTDLIADEASRQVRAHDFSAQPLFLYVAFNAPHSPYQTPEEDDPGLPDTLPQTRRDFARMVRALDRGVGRLVAALEEQGVMDNTIIVFSSDNGGVAPRQRADNRPFRDGKGSVYEGGVRSNGFIWYPGKIEARQVELPMHTVDWYPTLVHAAGGEVHKDNLDGINQWERLTGAAPAEDPDRVILLNTAPRASALRQGPWKLVRTRTPAGETTTSLYHLPSDVGETTDVAAEHAADFERLSAELDRFESEQATPLVQQQ